MSFSFGGSGGYQNNDQLAESGETFNILRVRKQPGEGFEGADRWLIVTDLAEPNITLGCNKGRDATLEALAAHLRETKKPYGPVELTKSKRAYYFNDVGKPLKGVAVQKARAKPKVEDDGFDEIPF